MPCLRNTAQTWSALTSPKAWARRRPFQRPIKARFVEPMLLRRTDSLPDGTDFVYEVKLEGYRAMGMKTGGKVHLRSRNNKDFNSRYPTIASALGTLPDET